MAAMLMVFSRFFGRLPTLGALAVVAALAACGGTVDPGDRAPLPPDYEPPPIDGFPEHQQPSRI